LLNARGDGVSFVHATIFIVFRVEATIFFVFRRAIPIRDITKAQRFSWNAHP
jgi:hypothetical protein